MGFAHKGVCHSKIETAQAAFCQSMTMSGISSTGSLVVANCSAITPPNITVLLKNGTAAQTTQTIAIPSFAACAHDGGVSMSLDYFFVALAFLAIIAASKAVLNIFRGRTDVA